MSILEANLRNKSSKIAKLHFFFKNFLTFFWQSYKKNLKKNNFKKMKLTQFNSLMITLKLFLVILLFLEKSVKKNCSSFFFKYRLKMLFLQKKWSFSYFFWFIISAFIFLTVQISCFFFAIFYIKSKLIPTRFITGWYVLMI